MSVPIKISTHLRMVAEALTKEDKNKLISELSQLILVFILAGIVSAIVLAVGMLTFNESESDIVMENRKNLTLLLIAATLMILLTFGWLKLSKPLKDILVGKKLTVIGTITNKSTNTNYGYHGSIGADLVSQPKLIEHFLYIDNNPYCVEREIYRYLNIGDKVVLSFTYYRNKLINIEKLK